MTTFKIRVDSFWKWFSEHASSFYATIEDGKCEDLTDPVAEACKEFLPGFSWVFGPGENEQGHSFTLTGEGKPGFLLLTSYWLKQAPELEGWTFYSSRQPSDLTGNEKIRVGELEFGPDELLVKPLVYEEDERIGLDFWHPSFAELDEDLRFTVFGLWLDESLGEVGSMSWIASAECQDLSSDPAAFPMVKLKSYVDYLQQENGWEKLPPEETYMVYKMPEPSDAFPRADTISGSTCSMELIGAYFDSEGQMEDMIEGTGASFVYVAINRELFPKGGEVDFRSALEEAIDATLQSNSSGRVLGGAFGLQSGYVDALIYDGENSVALIQEVLAQKQIDDYVIRPFANAR